MGDPLPAAFVVEAPPDLPVFADFLEDRGDPRAALVVRWCWRARK